MSMASSTANSLNTARKTKTDKYDFNPQDNLQRRKKLFRLIKQGHLLKQSIRIGQYQTNQEREEGPCAQSYSDHQTCLIENDFRLIKCRQLQMQITKCEQSSGLIDASVKRAINILESRRVNEWRVNEIKGTKQ